MSEDRIAAVLEAASDALVVVDEAYVDYAGESLRAWRARFPNLAILRTLSKIGLAALRIGWLEADEQLVRQLDKVRQPFNVSATSQAAASAVLADAWAEVLGHVRWVVTERDRIAATLRAMPGVEVAPSDANFLWMATPRGAGQVCDSLLAAGVLVKGYHAVGGRMAHRVRVTIGASEQNDRFVETLVRVLAA